MSEPKFKGGNALMNLEPGPPPKKILTFGEVPSRPQESSQPSRSSQLLQSSQLPERPGTGYESSQLVQSSQPQESRQPPQSSQVSVSRPINLMASLPDVRGYFELPHQITDHLYRHIDVYEQAAFVQLYRLSWGFGSRFCFISNPKLAERANMSASQVKKVVSRLIDKGLIRKTGNVQGFGKNQGVEYDVSAPTWQSQRSSQLQQGRQLQGSSQPRQSPNKEEVKEIDKGELARCPDCFGSGWWYPEGTEKGAKSGCQHKRLT